MHVIGPEQGFTLPGTTIVCGDSHTSHPRRLRGAGAWHRHQSEVEHVLATQTLIQKKAKNMLVRVDGQLPPGVTAKDIILAIIGEIGTAGGTGYVIEFAGEAIRALSMEGRMTVCNMTIEGGARAGLIAPDETTFAYISRVKPRAPKGCARWDMALEYWKTLQLRDEGAHFDKRRRARCRPTCRRSSPGALARGRRLGRGRRAGSRTNDPGREQAHVKVARARLYGPRSPERRSPTSPSTASSSAPAPTAASRIFVALPRRPVVEGRTVADRRRHDRPGLRACQARRPKPKGSIAIFKRKPASSGASRAAPCASP